MSESVRTIGKTVVFFAALSLLFFLCVRPTKELSGGSTITDNAQVRGRAFHKTGLPAKGALVKLRPKDYMRPPAAAPDTAFRRDTVADDSGAFVLDSLKLGDFRIEINDMKSEALLLSCAVASKRDSVVLPPDTLRAYTGITGKVDSLRLGKAPLFVQIEGLDRIAAIDTATGAFAVSDLPPGTYTVRIVSPDTAVKPVAIDSVKTDTGVTTVVIDTPTVDTGGKVVFGAWTRVDGPYLIGFDCAAVNSQGVLFVGSLLNGMYYSTDRGASWAPSGIGITKADFSCLAAATAPGGSDYPPTYAGSATGGIFRATANHTWTALTSGYPGFDTMGIRALATDKSGALVFAGTARNGILKSADGGGSWTALSGGSGFPGSTVNCIAVSQPAEGNIALLAGAPLVGVFRSADTGATWTATGSGAVECLAVDTGGKTVFAGSRTGVYSSDDGGVAWTPRFSPPEAATTFPPMSIAASGATVIASFGTAGVFRSTDGGANWSAMNGGLPTLSINSLAAGAGSIFSCPEDYGVYFAAMTGGSWIAADQTLPGQSIFQLVSGGTDLYMRTWSGILRSGNDGASWTKIWYKIPPFGFSSFAVCRQGTSGSTLFAVYNDSLFSSTDNGANWSGATGIGREYRIKTVSVAGSLVFAGMEYTAAVTGGTAPVLSILKSADCGATWAPVRLYPNDSYVFNIAAAPGGAGGQTLFITALNLGVLRSTDGGEHWAALDSGLPERPTAMFRPLAVNPYGPGPAVIFAGTSETIFCSSDNGESWAPVSGGFPQTTGINDLCVWRSASGRAYLFAATRGDPGLFYSTDNGANWTAASVNGPGEAGPMLAIHNRALWFAGQNVWKTPLP